MKKREISYGKSSVRVEIARLEANFNNAKTDYYRYVIRSEDKTLFSKLVKIPDSWENYQNIDGVNLTDKVKSRLSDIKRKKTWELKLQSLYFIYITSIENNIISVLQQRTSDKQELKETTDSISNIILELESDMFNIKHLLLTLAKRSISDFFYLISAYTKFFYKKNFQYENDIKIILSEFIKLINDQILFAKNLETLKKVEAETASLFQSSTNVLGWRIDEFALKDFIEKENQASRIYEFSKLLQALYEYKNRLRSYYNFLKYYYNENDGKLFRLNFVHESLKQKSDEQKITMETFNAFENIRNSFIEYKQCFEVAGIPGFGDLNTPYIEIVHSIYKLCKILEFYYLRNMKYEDLQELRNKYLLYIEKEIYAIT